jgi:hypothetical protein
LAEIQGGYFYVTEALGLTYVKPYTTLSLKFKGNPPGAVSKTMERALLTCRS